MTGGSDECWWKCQIADQSDSFSAQTFFVPPTCMADCFPDDHCISSLLADYEAVGGVCPGYFGNDLYPGVYQESDQQCEFDDYGFVVRGLCSLRTLELLRDQENCVIPIFSLKRGIYFTIRIMILSMCGYETYSDFLPAPLDRKVSKNLKEKRKSKTTGAQQQSQAEHLTNEDAKAVRLVPIELSYGENYFYEGSPIIARVPPLEHTKHRYPWLCSLRSVGEQSSHKCGVTLLARPPGPTVLVTSAHCVYSCKNEEGKSVPNCCCPNVGPGLCTDKEDCGTNAKTVLMTGDDTEVICGEWDTATDTAERYNVILPLVKISIHPDFNISRGEQNSQFVAADIATIHVSDDNFEEQSRTHNINPACLPTRPLSDTTSVVHSGWSTPPPLEYVINNAPEYEDFHQYFSKQWHYSLNITKCEDPKTYVNWGWEREVITLNFPSNSFYPPGTVCAVEKEGKFCPTSGESGSPLMVTDDEGRMVVEGINSFIKVLKI